MPADFRIDAVTALFDDLADPLVVIFIVGEQRQPRSEIFELEILGAGCNQFLHFRIEDRREREAEVLCVLVVLEVGMPREICRARSDGYFDRCFGVSRRDLVEIREPDWSARHRTAVDDSAPVVQNLFALARAGVDIRWMRFTRRIKSADAFIHVPAE